MVVSFLEGYRPRNGSAGGVESSLDSNAVVLGEGAEAAVPAWVPLAVGVVALVAFVLRQRSLQRRDRALLDLRTFSSRTFTISASA